MAYFEQIGPATFRPTKHVSGAWRTDEQHVGPSLGLLTHLVLESMLSRGVEHLLPARLSFDIYGTAPMSPVECTVDVLRPGRTVELIEARQTCAGRTMVVLRAWALQTNDTSAVAGSPAPAFPSPDELQPWDPTTVWPGGYIASAEVRRREQEPGRAQVWVRPKVPLLSGADADELAQQVALLDIINGMTVRHKPREVAFPNVDLTVHLLRRPAGDWLGFDTSVSFGAEGIGLTHSELYDETGHLGTLSQILTVRPG